MEDPGTLLALFTAVLCPSAASALGKLSGVFFPFSALVVRALSNPAFRVILAAEITHYHACPVLHLWRMMSDGELLNQWEDVEVIWLEVLFYKLLLLGWKDWQRLPVNEQNLAFWDL
jgi:hypothetical protein